MFRPRLILLVQQRQLRVRASRLRKRRLWNSRGEYRDRLRQRVLLDGLRNTHRHRDGLRRTALVWPDVLQQHEGSVFDAGLLESGSALPVQECELWVWTEGLREWRVRHRRRFDGHCIWVFVLCLCYGYQGLISQMLV
jgi:hypothetical protein